MLFSWGQRTEGVLGLVRPHVTEDTNVVPTPSLIGLEDVASLSSGCYHSVAVTESGSAYAWGRAASGRLGTSLKDEYQRIPCLISKDCRFLKVSCGAHHNVAITLEGVLMTWGSGYSGQCGHRSRRDVAVPTVVKTVSQRKFIDVSGGTSHSLALDDSGSVWSFGTGNFGELGLDTERFEPNPKKLVVKAESGEEVKFVSVFAGEFNSAAIDDHGRMYVWGGNQYGQLGIKGGFEKESYRSVPAQLSLSNVSLTETNEETGGESGGKKRVRTGSHSSKGGSPSTSKRGRVGSKNGSSGSGKRVVAVAFGKYTGYALTAKGDLFEWGRSPADFSKVRELPQLVPCPEKLVHVFARDYYIAVVSEKGNAYFLGSNNSGQILPFVEGMVYDSLQLVDSLRDVVSIGVGSQFGVALRHPKNKEERSELEEEMKALVGVPAIFSPRKREDDSLEPLNPYGSYRPQKRRGATPVLAMSPAHPRRSSPISRSGSESEGYSMADSVDADSAEDSLSGIISSRAHSGTKRSALPDPLLAALTTHSSPVLRRHTVDNGSEKVGKTSSVFSFLTKPKKKSLAVVLDVNLIDISQQLSRIHNRQVAILSEERALKAERESLLAEEKELLSALSHSIASGSADLGS
eukprot:TRINITY_DN4369_c0_g1_i1.p1 TRINITY_DN4369_c0_g1~~TRINITY_DN4369_c0_g1_i1.p1  ORF type:complete len:660 (+),score=110.42 TRINITY_DN4369_c0_g1_i1:83-1981(+)